jgi:hypothetical protein
MFLKGKYSKLSQQAKEKITDFHTFYDRGAKILIEIAAALDPLHRFPMLGGPTAMEYVADSYGLSLEEMRKVGELGSIYDKKEETLEL